MYGDFAEWVDFAHWWSFSGEGSASAAWAAGLFRIHPLVENNQTRQNGQNHDETSEIGLIPDQTSST